MFCHYLQLGLLVRIFDRGLIIIFTIFLGLFAVVIFDIKSGGTPEKKNFYS